MHDTMLLNRISEAITETCKVNNIRNVYPSTVVVSDNSHIKEKNPQEHLQSNLSDLIGEWTQIDIYKENIESNSNYS